MYTSLHIFHLRPRPSRRYLNWGSNLSCWIHNLLSFRCYRLLFCLLACCSILFKTGSHTRPNLILCNGNVWRLLIFLNFTRRSIFIISTSGGRLNLLENMLSLSAEPLKVEIWADQRRVVVVRYFRWLILTWGSCMARLFAIWWECPTHIVTDNLIRTDHCKWVCSQASHWPRNDLTLCRSHRHFYVLGWRRVFVFVNGSTAGAWLIDDLDPLYFCSLI